MLEWNANKAMLPKCSVDHQKCLVDHLVNKTHVGTHVAHMLRWSHDQRNTPYEAHALLFYFIFVSITMQVPPKEEETDTYKAL